MNKFFRIRAIQLCLVLVVSCLCISCSHLNVDFDSSWSARDISVVVVEHEQAPAEVTTSDIVSILTRSGWHVVADRDQAQARVVCRWMRQPDLNAESEPVEVIKSFHVQVISIQQPKILAVSDYFYSNNDEELLDGVNAALTALTQGQVAPVSQPALSKSQPVAPQNSVVAPKRATPVVNTITSKPTSVVPIDSVIQSDAHLRSDEQSITVEELTPVAIEPISSEPEQEVLPLEPADNAGPVSMEKSPWVPRFQGMGLEEWGKE